MPVAWVRARGRRLLGGCLLVSALVAVASGCGGSSAPSGSSTVPVGTDPSAGSVVAPTESAASPAASAVLDAASGQLQLDADQRSCVIARLDQDRDLLGALGSDPVASPRFADLASLAQDCINSVSFSAAMVSSLQAQAGGSLSAAQLACLRQGFGALSSSDVSAMITAGLEPGTSVPSDGVGAKLDSIYGGCGVDRSKLPPVGG